MCAVVDGQRVGVPCALSAAECCVHYPSKGWLCWVSAYAEGEGPAAPGAMGSLPPVVWSHSRPNP